MPEASGRLALAEESLRSAELLVREGLYRDSVSRAYYAMFHAARAILASQEVHPRTHGGVLQEIGRLFVKPGLLDRTSAGDLGFAQQLRQRADYEEDLAVTESDARGLIERARRFVGRARDLLGN